MKTKLKYLLATVLLITLSCCFAVSAAAEEVTEEAATTADENVFSAVYDEIALHAGDIL